MIAKTLQKKDGTSFTDISPITGSECVTYNSSTVKDELDYILSALGSMISSSDIDAKITKACSDLYDRVLGTTDHSSINTAYDTLKEVADYLDSHGTVVAGIQSDISNLRAAVDALAPVATSGSYNDLTDKPTNATTTQDGLMSKEDKALLSSLSTGTVKSVTKGSTNGYITVNGTTDIEVYKLPVLTPSDVGLGNVGNFKAVSTVAGQGLSDSEQAAARANIGASSFSGSYTDLTNKPTNATTSADGFMSAADKTKLESIAAGAGKTIVAKGAVNGHITVDGTDIEVYKAETIPDATTSTSGLMSATDKTKLDNLPTSAVSSIAKGSTNGHITVNGTDDIEVYTAEAIPEATTSEAGLMSAADKTKLDGLGGGSAAAGDYSTPTAITFTNSTYYSLDSSGVNKSYIDNGIVFACMKITCNKLVVPQADTTVATLYKPVMAVEFDNLPATNETQYPPINIKVTEDGNLTILGGASGCTYNVYLQYGLSKDDPTTSS